MKRFLSLVWLIGISIFIICEDVPDRLRNLGEEDDQTVKTNVRRILILFWISAFLILIITVGYFYARPTVFNIIANVEKVSLSRYADQSLPDWRIDQAILHHDCGENSVEVSGGHLYPDETAYIDFQRLQTGELTINLDSEESDSVGTFVSDSQESILLDDCATLRLSVDQGKAYIFPLEGEIQLGGEIKEGSASLPILNSGSVTIIDRAFVSRVFYTVGPFELSRGDVFVIEDLVLRSSGFLQVDTEEGMYVTYSSKGKRGFIKKYKTEPVEIRNGLWTKFYNDPSLILLWFIGIAIYTITRTVLRINMNNLL